MRTDISIHFTPEEVVGILCNISDLYDVAYPKIKDWVDSQQAKQIKSKYRYLTDFITALNMMEVDLAVARKTLEREEGR